MRFYRILVSKELRLGFEIYENPGGTPLILDDREEARRIVDNLIRKPNDYVWADYEECNRSPFPKDLLFKLFRHN